MELGNGLRAGNFTKPVLAKAILIRILFVFAMMLSIVADSALPPVNMTAPDFALKTTTGENLRISEYRSEVVLVNFWASWCRTCRSEIPLLRELADEYAGTDVHVLSVNIDDDAEHVGHVIRDMKINYPVLLDDQHRVAKLYDLPKLPVTMLIDREGVLRFVHSGYKSGDEAFYRDELARLAAE